MLRLSWLSAPMPEWAPFDNGPSGPRWAMCRCKVSTEYEVPIPFILYINGTCTESDTNPKQSTGIVRISRQMTGARCGPQDMDHIS